MDLMEEKMEVCKICGKEYKKITTMHVRTHGISMEQYKKSPEFEEVEDIEVEPTGNTKFTQEERAEKIFGNQERDVNRPLVEFLNEFGVTEKEARAILKKFTKGEKVDPVVQAKNFKRIGSQGAEKLKDKDNVETTSLHIAEELSENYGFVVTSVRGAKGNVPKTWFLTKQ
jgi:hypothetical protein